MATINLTFTEITTSDGTIVYDSNLIQVNGEAGVHVEMPGTGNSIEVFRSITGLKYLSFYHDYFAEIFEKDLVHLDISPNRRYISSIGYGVVLKFRFNRLPDYGVVMGDVENLGDVDPDNPDDIANAFAGSEGVYFQDINSEYFVGRSTSLNTNPNY